MGFGGSGGGGEPREPGEQRHFTEPDEEGEEPVAPGQIDPPGMNPNKHPGAE
ncbi:MAG: hypothetical protein AAB573_00970 [Patescibacteria group bacterium]